MATIQHTPRVFLIGNAQKPNVSTAFDKMSKWLDELGVLVGSDLEGKPETLIDTHPDYVMALGGDGTILGVGQAMQNRQVPIIGVNLGKLGYLAHFSTEDVERHISHIFGDTSLVSRRMILDILISSPSGRVTRGIAINDCVIRVGEPFRTVGISVNVDDHPVTTLVSDGLIIATPTGSTAHNMACGGPILFPDVDAIILTPLSPHSLTHRPVVVGPDAKVSIAVRPTSSGAAVVLDGQWVTPLPGGSSITIRRSATTFQLVENPDRRSWDLLVQKLRWGQALT